MRNPAAQTISTEGREPSSRLNASHIKKDSDHG